MPAASPFLQTLVALHVLPLAWWSDVAGLCLIVGMLAGLGACPYLAKLLLRPVTDRATRNRAFQYHIGDFGALVFYLSVAIRVGTAPLSMTPLGDQIAMGLTPAMLLLTTTIWAAAVAIPNQANVNRARKRAAYLLVAVPLACLLPLTGLIALSTSLWIVVMPSPEPDGTTVTVSLAILLGAFVVAYGCHGLSTWVATD